MPFFLIFELNMNRLKILLFSISFGLIGQSFSQVTLDPVFALQTDTVMVYYDATKGNAVLKDLGPPDVYIHSGVITELSKTPVEWRYVKGVWGTDDLPRKMTYVGNNVYRFKLHIPTFYGVPANEKVLKLAFVFRDKSGNKVGRNADGTDIFATIFQAGLKATFTSPAEIPGIFETGDTLKIIATISEKALVSFYDNGVLVDTQTTSEYKRNVTGLASGNHRFVVKALKGGITASDTLNVMINSKVKTEALPAGMLDGVNYLNDSTVLFSLYAPNKKFVYVNGDFSNWQLSIPQFMNKTPDGKRWWAKISGLKPGTQYGYQFIVDGILKIADPLSELLLDPWNDGFINKADFQGLPNYPSGKTTGLVSVIRPGLKPFDWKNRNFKIQDPAKLNVYELHIRDFIATHSYTVLIDTLAYLKRLGINAIELMPVNEFEGNSSWGYNSSYHIATDKYYGSPEQLKAFIDECHKQGMAVFLDAVLNHAFGQSSLCQLYWNSSLNQPAADNPWLNPVARHDFNVGYDFNHESPATQTYVDRVIKYWLTEFDVDGFRFDLSKGFTQNNTLGNTTAWGYYDASRIALWKRIRDVVRSYNSDALLILEHFADNSEEKELAGEGFYFWGNANGPYTEASMGYSSDLNWGSNYKARGWNAPRLLSYMESHDEERMMYKNITFGNSNGAYNVKTLATGLKRTEMAAVIFFSIPGPKMIWQFGELGYDVGINTNGRTGEKPIRWEYIKDQRRLNVYNVFATMMNLRNQYQVFHTGNNNFELNSPVKKAWLQDNGQFVHMIANTDVKAVNSTLYFQDTGKWYEVFSGDSMRIGNIAVPVNLQAGEYRLYSNVKMPAVRLQIPLSGTSKTDEKQLRLFPNPAQNQLFVSWNGQKAIAECRDLSGKLIAKQTLSNGFGSIQTDSWAPGIYFVRLNADGIIRNEKIIIQR